MEFDAVAVALASQRPRTWAVTEMWQVSGRITVSELGGLASSMDLDDETVLRERIMASLAARVLSNGGSITRAELEAFPVSGTENRRLIDTSKGIWNPRDLQATLSVLSSRDGAYADRELEGGLFQGRLPKRLCRGNNSKLRRAADLGLPIILLLKISTGVFVPIFPVYVLGDDAANRQFVLALDESLRLIANPLDPTDAERRYAARVVTQRLHQAEFRGRVIRAYRTRCAVCSLRHGELLDAAHIVPDGEPLGQPVVSNGLSLQDPSRGVRPQLTWHHANLIVRINNGLLAEIDGPMLEHGLKGMHRAPNHRPIDPRTTTRPGSTRSALPALPRVSLNREAANTADRTDLVHVSPEPAFFAAMRLRGDRHASVRWAWDLCASVAIRNSPHRILWPLSWPFGDVGTRSGL